MNIFLKTFIRIVRPFIISCQEATYLKMLEKHDKLPLKKKINLRCHVWRCKLCQRYIREWEFIEKAVRKLNNEPEPATAAYKLSDAKKEEIKKCMCGDH
jgi:hypothetical protein